MRGRARLMLDGLGELRRLHRAHPFDLLHAFWADEPGALSVAAGRAFGVPVAVSVMGGELAALEEIGYGAALGRGGRWATSLALRGADLVTVGSTTLFRSVASVAPGTPLRQLPLGVDRDAFHPNPPAPAGGPTLLFVGSLTAVKDPVLLLRAFARVPGTAGLVIAGDGPLRSGLERLVGTLAVAHRVRFAGWVPRATTPALYRGASALVVCSRHEAQSMVAVEAAACGIPVVGTPVGVVPELADAGGAIVTPVGDVAALAAALTRVLGDEATRRELGAAAGAHAAHAWDRRQQSERFADAWVALATSARRAGGRRLRGCGPRAAGRPAAPGRGGSSPPPAP